MKYALHCSATAAMLSLACSGLGISDEQTGVADGANVCVDGTYVGPEPGTRLAAGSRDDECLGATPTDDTSASLTAVTKNSCSWRLMLIESGETLEEGACATALANDSMNGATLGLYSFGAVSLASESRFAFSAHIDKLWCELQDGFPVSDTQVAPAFEWFAVFADYTGPSEGAPTTNDTTLFRCALSNTGKEEAPPRRTSKWTMSLRSVGNVTATTTGCMAPRRSSVWVRLSVSVARSARRLKSASSPSLAGLDTKALPVAEQNCSRSSCVGSRIETRRSFSPPHSAPASRRRATLAA